SAVVTRRVRGGGEGMARRGRRLSSLRPRFARQTERVDPISTQARSESMEKISFVLNGAVTSVDVDPTTPLLWVLRDHLGLTGTKYGCGMAVCGCCTVHLNGDAVRSCVTPVARASGQKVTTVEGLSPDLSHAVQSAWLAEQVPQCGYCQSGQLMSAACL